MNYKNILCIVLCVSAFTPGNSNTSGSARKYAKSALAIPIFLAVMDKVGPYIVDALNYLGPDKKEDDSNDNYARKSLQQSPLFQRGADLARGIRQKLSDVRQNVNEQWWDSYLGKKLDQPYDWITEWR